jgi:hypothetical protein
MAVRKKEVGSLTGSKRFKEEKSNSVGNKAKELASNIGTKLTANETVSSIANVVTTTVSNVSQASNDIKQSIQAVTGTPGYSKQLASSNLDTSSVDAYGGVAIPQIDFTGLVPTDLLNPSISLKATDEQLTNGLAEYAAGTRAQRLLQAGFKYIEEVGKTKQQFHRAEQSIIKGATEGIKTQQEIVKFDTQRVQLDIEFETLEQRTEKLKQAQITTLAGRNETEQLRQKFEAIEGKREATIHQLKAQSIDITQRFLKDSITQSAN